MPGPIIEVWSRLGKVTRRRFRSTGQARRFLAVGGVVQNLFRLGRHHLQSENYRLLRDWSFGDWREVTAA